MSAGDSRPGKSWTALSGVLGKRRAKRGESAARALGLSPPPALAFFPEDPSEVSIVINAARDEGIPLVTIGTASRINTLPKLELPAGRYVGLGLGNLTGVIEVQPDSLWMSALAGTPWREIISSAAKHGLRPVGAPSAGSLGGWLSVCSFVDDIILGVLTPPVIGLEAVLPTGNLIRSVTTPRAAMGPDIFSLFLGTWGGLGVITSATLRLEPLPEKEAVLGWRVASVAGAVRLLKRAARDFLPPRSGAIWLEIERGRRGARMALSYQGARPIVEACEKFMLGSSEGKGIERASEAEVRSWIADGQIVGGRVYTAPVNWSHLPGLLKRADKRLGRVSKVMIDRPQIEGCRLRLTVDKPLADDVWRELVDPRGEAQASLETARSFMSRVRAELDPQGFVNPHAWPLPWVGGEG